MRAGRVIQASVPSRSVRTPRGPRGRGRSRRRSRAPGPRRRPVRASSARVKRSNARSANSGEAPRPRPRRATRPCRPRAARRPSPRPRRASRRSRSGCRAPARAAGGRRGARGRRAPRPEHRGPACGSARRRRRAARAPRTVSILSGSVPRSDRASTSRSSARRLRRSVSSVAERSAPRNSSAVRSRRSASSSSVFRLASGVRSSWLASATKPRSRSMAASSRASIALSVSPSRPISSSAGGSGSRSPGLSSLIAGGLPAHRLDGPQRGGGDRVAGERRERERDRQPEAEQQAQGGERLLVVVGRLADHERWAVHRHGEDPAGSPSSTASSRVMVRDPSRARLDLVGAEERAGAARLVPSRTLPSASRIWVKLSSLSPKRSSPAFGSSRALALDQRGDVRGARAQRLVGVLGQAVLEARVDDEPEAGEHDAERQRERQGQPDPDRDPAHERSR